MPKPPKPTPTEKIDKPQIRADITPEMDAKLEKAVALYKLRGDRELGDRSKLVRHAVEKFLLSLEAQIEAVEAAAQAPAPSRKPK